MPFSPYRLFIMNFSMVFAAASQGVYDPYATSYFRGHSLIATANIIHGIVRIVGYPLFAKVADVSNIDRQSIMVRSLLTTHFTQNSILDDRRVSPERRSAWRLPTSSTPPATMSRLTWCVHS
jgi:hypothetical protein